MCAAVHVTLIADICYICCIAGCLCPFIIRLPGLCDITACECNNISQPTYTSHMLNFLAGIVNIQLILRYELLTLTLWSGKLVEQLN